MVLDLRIDSRDSQTRRIDTICYGFLSRVGTKLGTSTADDMLKISESQLGLPASGTLA